MCGWFGLVILFVLIWLFWCVGFGVAGYLRLVAFDFVFCCVVLVVLASSLLRVFWSCRFVIDLFCLLYGLLIVLVGAV